MLVRLGLGLGLFLGSLAIGWWLAGRGVLTEDRASRLVRWIVIGPSPATLCLSFWEMDLRTPGPWLLPFLGLVISCSTLAPAMLYARRAGMSRSETGSFLTCALFSNVGYFSAFAVFALFGEEAYALCMLYLVFFTPCFYTLGFWLASRYGHGAAGSDLKGAFNSELRAYPFLGMLAGAALSLARVPRPVPLQWLNHILIPFGTAAYLIAIGSQMVLASPRPWLTHGLAMSGIKFLYTPLVASVLLTALDIRGLPRTVVLLEAAAPVAVSSLVLPLLFGLDRKLSNALWLLTTLLAIPWFLVLIPLIARG